MHSTQYGDENSLDLNITVLFPSLSVSLSVSPRACRCMFEFTPSLLSLVPGPKYSHCRAPIQGFLEGES